MKRVKMIVSGLVQGVGFRRLSRKRARSVGLTGMVWNREDNTVEIEAQGNEETINGFIKWTHYGVPNARVENVETSEIALAENETEFRIVK
jgi:acylphosphatase